MTSDNILDCLHTCDKLGFEMPQGFDAGRVKTMVGTLKKSLDRLLLKQVQGPFEDQDCTYFARLRLPVEINSSGDECELYVSNFGDMVAIQNEGNVRKEHLAVIKESAEQVGFHWMNEADLLKAYDGKCYPGFETWWHRFFDYV